MRPPHDEDFHDLIAERYERVSTMLTSNLDFAEWGASSRPTACSG
ncbi:ATP-binding protein [Acidithiobacillus ferrooxidans]|nr:ATP-binding protein [Acidithiobacillus ferrooxidans]